ncbi:MAG: ABC transporter permease [Planctomycetota bacterium]|nr:ABC transporter permease [Planctomycetota bacterium]
MGASFYAISLFFRELIRSTGETILLGVESILWIRRAPRQIGEILNQLHICTFKALPVVSVFGAFTGMVVALQTGNSLKTFDAQDMVGGVNAISLAREMGPVMTSIILAGLVGSAMAAEIGTMKVSDEIDALTVMSISPVRYLMMPRLVALTLACPLLTIYNDVLGFIAGGLIAATQLGVDPDTYLNVGKAMIDNSDIYSGLAKSLLFGVIIATISCNEGMKAEGGALGVGRATRSAVVKSFLWIIIFDYFLASLFTQFVY